MNYKDITQKSPSELQELLAEQRSELQSLQFKVAHQQETKVREVRKVKKIIARILTVLNIKVKAND